MNRINLTLPKGSLERGTYELLERAFYKVSGQERTYRPRISDPEISLKVLRPQEIPVFVAGGLYDVGITGADWVQETEADVKKLLDLKFGRVKLIVAVPDRKPSLSVDSLLEDRWSEGAPVRISTEYLNIATKYIKSREPYKVRFGSKEPKVVTPWWTKGRNEDAVIYLSFGATEAKPPEDAEMIVDVMETGTSLQQNGLRVVDTILESSAWLITNKVAMKDPWKKEKILGLMASLKGVVDARERLHIFVNVREENLPKLLKEIPALKKPTVGKLSEEGWYAVNTVIERSQLHDLLPALRRLAQGVVVHEPQQVLSIEEMMEESGL